MRFEAIFESNQYYGSPSARRCEAILGELRQVLPRQPVEVEEEVVADGLVRCILLVAYDAEGDPCPPPDEWHQASIEAVTEAMESIGLYAVRVVSRTAPASRGQPHPGGPGTAAAGVATGGAAAALAGAAAAGVALLPDGPDPHSAAATLVGAVLGGLLGAMAVQGAIELVGARQGGRWQFWRPERAAAVTAPANR